MPDTNRLDATPRDTSRYDSNHYFSAKPSVASAPKSVELALPDLKLTLATDRGVFSADRVDAGTKYLLLDGPMPTEPALVADVGCGYGPIAVTLAKRFPAATVWGIDVNERARGLCQANALSAGCTNVEVYSPDQVPSGKLVDAVYANPPLRTGKEALHELLLEWLGRLAPSGVLIQVVHRHLGADSLQRWLEDSGWPTERLGSRAGYRLLRSSRQGAA